MTFRAFTWNVSSEQADFLFDLFNWILIIGAFAVFVGTIGAIKMGTARDFFADARLRDHERAISAANAAAADANERAATVEKEAQQLRAANLMLEKQIQPRRLSGEDSTKLEAGLSKMQHLPICIVSRFFDPEGTDFADDLANAFNKAEWPVVRQRNWTMSQRGVAIASLEGTNLPPELTKTLVGALAGAGVEATVTVISAANQNTTSPYFQPGLLYLLIGVKP